MKMVKRLNRKTGEQVHMVQISTTVHVDEHVDVEEEVDVEKFVSSMDADGKAALLAALKGAGPTPRADEAYYAFHRGDMGKVKEFICEMAGRIA